MIKEAIIGRWGEKGKRMEAMVKLLLVDDEFFVLDFGPIVLEFDMENIDIEIGKENNYVRDKRESKFSYLFRKSCGR